MYVATYIVTAVQDHLKLIPNRLWLNTCQYVLCLLLALSCRLSRRNTCSKLYMKVKCNYTIIVQMYLCVVCATIHTCNSYNACSSTLRVMALPVSCKFTRHILCKY